MIQHPDPNANPTSELKCAFRSLPNFSDIVAPAGAAPQGQLPPGHPP